MDSNSAAPPPTLREKIGQMLLIGFRGLEITGATPVAVNLAERNLGGVVLFDQEMADRTLPGRNVQSREQLKALVTSIHTRAQTPPFITIDQEGGKVARLKPSHGFATTRSQRSLGTLNDLTQTHSNAESIAQMLESTGINFNLAPVLDLEVNPTNPIIAGKERSFSADPGIVTSHAIEFVKTHHAHGIITCAKHFPGHGSSRDDTHLGLADVTRCWTEQELLPYQQLMEAGLCDAVMTAHIFNANLDSQRPATLSRAVVTGILRERLGFDGVILSDDLEMKAISAHYTLEQTIQHAIEAGLDVLCLGNNMNFDPHIGERAANLVHGLVEAGKISENRIDESFQRIMRLKRKFKLL